MACSYPKTVDVLEPDDFIVGDYTDGEGRCCFIGHINRVFGPAHDPRDDSWKRRTDAWSATLQAMRMTSAALKAADIMWPGNTNHTLFIINDKTAEIHDQRAKWWGIFIALLGYTEGNPYAKYAKKRKAA